MPGFLGMISPETLPMTRFAKAAATLDLLGRTPVSTLEGSEFSLAASSLPDAPLAGPYLCEDGDLAGCFAGDLHHNDEVPWADIFESCRSGSHDWVDRVEGHFAAAIHDKRSHRLYLFADHFGCQPIFYARHGQGFVFSTQLAAFVRLGIGGGFSEEWLHRFLFFGYWSGAATYLEGVKRLPPGTRLCFDATTGEMTLSAYETRFTSVDPPARGQAAIDMALERFHGCVPRMFECDRPIQWALSAGLDSRTIYAFLPEDADVRAFTYGIEGCDDQLEAAITARRLGVPHRQFFFDQEYERSLPSLIRETVWLSGGIAWINRCMLPAVYRFVARDVGRPAVLTSGIALDTLFRGHNNARGDLNNLLATGEITFQDPAFAELLQPDALRRFCDANTAFADVLTQEHGRLSRPESYLSYTAYTLCPSYFSADLEIGGHYAALRIPAYDRDIVRLAYEIGNSTIYFSKYVKHDLFDEYVLQASLMASHPKLARAPLQGVPLDVFVRHDKLSYQAYRLLKHGPRRIKRKLSSRGTRTPIEDWDAWFGVNLAGDMRSILRPGCLVSEYVRYETVARYIEANRWVWLARLATVELILQLMNSNWDLEALPPSLTER